MRRLLFTERSVNKSAGFWSARAAEGAWSGWRGAGGSMGGAAVQLRSRGSMSGAAVQLRSRGFHGWRSGGAVEHGVRSGYPVRFRQPGIRSDGVPGRLGDVLASGGCGPANGTVVELFSVPAGVLLEAMVMAAFRVPVPQARPAACLVGNVVLEIAPPGRPAAARPGTRRVPDLRQVPEHHPGIMAPGLPPVIAVPGGDRADLDEQVLLPGGEPPGAVPAGRPGLIGGGEGEPGSAGRIMPVRFSAF